MVPPLHLAYKCVECCCLSNIALLHIFVINWRVNNSDTTIPSLTPLFSWLKGIPPGINPSSRQQKKKYPTGFPLLPFADTALIVCFMYLPILPLRRAFCCRQLRAASGIALLPLPGWASLWLLFALSTVSSLRQAKIHWADSEDGAVSRFTSFTFCEIQLLEGLPRKYISSFALDSWWNHTHYTIGHKPYVFFLYLTNHWPSPWLAALNLPALA